MDIHKSCYLNLAFLCFSIHYRVVLIWWIILIYYSFCDEFSDFDFFHWRLKRRWKLIPLLIKIFCKIQDEVLKKKSHKDELLLWNIKYNFIFHHFQESSYNSYQKILSKHNRIKFVPKKRKSWKCSHCNLKCNQKSTYSSSLTQSVYKVMKTWDVHMA